VARGHAFPDHALAAKSLNVSDVPRFEGNLQAGWFRCEQRYVWEAGVRQVAPDTIRMRLDLIAPEGSGYASAHTLVKRRFATDAPSGSVES
jgi:hypothetical protein